MRKFLHLAALSAIFSISVYTAAAQSCVPTGINGSTVNLYCGQTCADLNFQVPDLKSTSDYVLASIPYLPFDYVTPGGTQDIALYDDDKYSFLTTLPFTFCFYDSVYNKVSIGSNGLITFDQANAGCANAYQIGPPIFNALGGSQCDQFASWYYPKASIMANYSDLNPEASASPAGRKIEWRVEGTAPCRKFIVSFYKVGIYSSSANACMSTPAIDRSNTFQIVLYESTGLIDMYYEQKFLCTNSSNGGKAIMGIQNWYRNKAVAGTDRNATNWSARKEGWRFTPSGGSSRFVSAELLDLSGAHIANAVTSPGTAGLLNLRFTGFCPTQPKYILKTIFTDCATAGNQLIGLDTFKVAQLTSLPLTGVATPTSCGGNSGTVTLTVPNNAGTPPYQYSVDGGPLGSGPFFIGLTGGNHSFHVIDALGCQNTITVAVPATGNLAYTAVNVPTGCPAVNNGSITITPNGGTAPFSYTITNNLGVSTGPQTSGTFSNLAYGFYTVTFSDAGGCSGSGVEFVPQGQTLGSTIVSTAPPCTGINNGTITVTPTSGTGPYSFSLNGGPPQSSGTFTGLAAGLFNISFTDAVGCSGTNSALLQPATAITATNTKQDVNCFNESNGSITIQPMGGTAPYQFSINGGINYQPSPTFSNLITGTYPINVRDANGCQLQTTFNVDITQPALLTATATATNATCNGNDGIIQVNAAGGTTAYQYSVDNGVTYQPAANFTVNPGNYNNILVKDAHGCTANTNATIILVDTMRLSFAGDTATCEGTPVALQPLTNNETSTFTWSPATGLSSTTIKNPAANPADSITYTLVAKWGSCTRTAAVRVNVLTKPVAHAGEDTAICFNTFALLRGSVTRTSGAVSFLWTPSGIVNQSLQPLATVRPDSTQLMTLEVIDNYGCNFRVTDDVLITVQPPVPAYAGNDTNAVSGIPHQLFSSGGVSYLWSPVGPLDNPFIQFPKAILQNDTRFTVTVTDVAGCIGTDDVLIKVYKGPTYYTPNAFTPNGDGINDIFRPTPVGIVKTDYFRVFNRYGQLIFETTKWLEGWNGFSKGKKQAAGTYIWMIRGTDRNGKIVEQKGTVILVQ